MGNCMYVTLKAKPNGGAFGMKILIVEGNCSRLCLHPHCFLVAMGSSPKCMDLAMHILGGFIRGLMVSSTIA